MKNVFCSVLLMLFVTNVSLLNASEKEKTVECTQATEEVDCVKFAHDKMEDEMEEFDIETPEEYKKGFDWWFEFCEREYGE